MDSYSSSLGTPFPWEEPVKEPVTQARDSPRLSGSRVPRPQEPDPSKAFRLPSPLEPDTTFLSEPNVPKLQSPSDNPPTELPTLSEFLNPANSGDMPSVDVPEGAEGVSNLEAKRKAALPFMDLQAVENLPDPLDEDMPHKCARLEGERLHLPAPRIQKETSRPFRPVSVLNGLNEPPPNAPLFPPIETDSNPTILTRPSRDPGEGTATETAPRQTGRGQRINDIIESKPSQPFSSMPMSTAQANEYLFGDPDDDGDEGVVAKAVTDEKKKKGLKTYRKWTEEESFELMRGIARCGVGHWTAILSQKDLKFNKRTAVNLKDRFRVCCPWAFYETEERMGAAEVNRRVAEYVMEAESGAARHASSAGDTEMPDATARRSETRASDDASESTSSNTEGKQKAKPRKKNNGTRGSAALSHRSKTALVSLGLDDPLTSIKSTRMRRTFSKEEDDNLFKGYLKHGFHWTAIQHDPMFKFDNRKSTVLRDRFRFRYPETYKRGGLHGIKYMYPLQGSPFAANMMAAAEQSQAGQPQQVPPVHAMQPVSWVTPGASTIQTRGDHPNAFPPSNTVPSDTQRAPPFAIPGRSGLIYPAYHRGIGLGGPGPSDLPGCPDAHAPPPNSNPIPDHPPTQPQPQPQPSDSAGGTTNSPQPIFPFSDDDAPQAPPPVGDPMEEDDVKWGGKSIPPFWGDFVE